MAVMKREERDNVGGDVNLLIESAVAGADRIIKNPRGQWQQTYGLRYRLDRITENGFSCSLILIKYLKPF